MNAETARLWWGGVDAGGGDLLKIPADDSLLQEQHFLIRKAIPRQKDVNENSNERVRAQYNGERERTHIYVYRDGFTKTVRGVKITKRRGCWRGGVVVKERQQK